MAYPEFSEQDIPRLPPIPTRITHDVIKSARQEGAIDRQFTYGRLKFLCRALELLEKPKLFTITEGDQFTRSTVLTVPTHDQRLASRQLFVAVNNETSTLGEDGFELRHISQYAYRWSIDGNRISRSDTTTATRPAWSDTWKYKHGFGPFVIKSTDFVYVKNWKADRLPLSSNTIGRLSIPGLAELKIAEELIDRVQTLTPGNEDEDIRLISEEL
jgi:hypothetical protein